MFAIVNIDFEQLAERLIKEHDVVLVMRMFGNRPVLSQTFDDTKDTVIAYVRIRIFDLYVIWLLGIDFYNTAEFDYQVEYYTDEQIKELLKFVQSLLHQVLNGWRT